MLCVEKLRPFFRGLPSIHIYKELEAEKTLKNKEFVKELARLKLIKKLSYGFH